MMTFHDAGEYLLAECEGRRLSPKTIRFYRQRLGSMEKILGNPPLRDITLVELRRAIAHGTESSAHHHYRTIKRLFSLLKNEGLITKDPSAQLQAPKLSKKVIDPLTTDDIVKLFKAARDGRGFMGVRDAAIFATLVGTGIRNDELCRLKDEDVRLKGGYMLINGKGRKQRMVPIPSKLKVHLSRWLLVRTTSTVADRSTTFFKSKHGNALTPDIVRKTMQKLAKRAGIRVWAHLCRHSFATHFMAQDGADVLSLQAICGWADLQMANRYAHAQLPKLQRSMEAFSPINEL